MMLIALAALCCSNTVQRPSACPYPLRREVGGQGASVRLTATAATTSLRHTCTTFAERRTAPKCAWDENAAGATSRDVGAAWGSRPGLLIRSRPMRHRIHFRCCARLPSRQACSVACARLLIRCLMDYRRALACRLGNRARLSVGHAIDYRPALICRLGKCARLVPCRRAVGGPLRPARHPRAAAGRAWQPLRRSCHPPVRQSFVRRSGARLLSCAHLPSHAVAGRHTD